MARRLVALAQVQSVHSIELSAINESFRVNRTRLGTLPLELSGRRFLLRRSRMPVQRLYHQHGAQDHRGRVVRFRPAMTSKS
jgi:hypothetical protein